MKLRTVSSDGTIDSDATFELVVHDEHGVPYDDPPVTITCRTIGGRERRSIRKKAESIVPGPRGRGQVREVDEDYAAECMVVAAVVSWEGVVGNDGKPVPCTDETKAELPVHVKVQIIERASNTEDVSQADSFRQSARVV